VQVRRVFVVNPNRIWANVAVAPNAAIGPISIQRGYGLSGNLAAVRIPDSGLESPSAAVEFANS